MKNIANMILTALWCMFPMGAYAQGGHWSCDERAYQYDMTAYISLVDDESGNAVNLSFYEVAAFVGSECRGIAKAMSLPEGGGQYGYLRIHSHVASGETVVFKVYNKATEREMEVVAESVAFEADDAKGLPSEPLVLTIHQPYTPGDVNYDGKVNIIDVMAVYAYILNQEPSPFNIEAADANGDGNINVIDVQRIYTMILNQQ